MSNMMTGSKKAAAAGTAAEKRKVKLEIKDMTKHYDNGDGVENINLKIYEGEIVTFLGLRLWKVHNPPDHWGISGCDFRRYSH